jgi:AcrR family transcriptional regulator
MPAEPTRVKSGRRRARLTQPERRAATRASVIKSAGRVFARRGYHGATLEEIAEAAGVSKGAVYYNFDSKEGLFLALLEQRLTERLGTVEFRHEHAGSPESQARDAASGFLAGIERDPRWPPLFFEFVAHCARDRKLRADLGSRFFETARELLAKVIRERAGEGEAELALAPEDLAVAISALVNGFAIERMFHPKAVSDDLLGTVVSLLIAAVTESAKPAQRKR